MKDKIPKLNKKKDLVYKIKYRFCNKLYIGHTSTNLMITKKTLC